MNEKPILFNTPMVKAILDGRKTQTRRVVLHSKRTPDYFGGGKFYKMVDSLNGKPFFGAGFYNDKNVFEHEGKSIIDAFYIKPKYEPGDILWVRETWAELCEVDANGYTHYDRRKFYYRTDGDQQIDLYDDNGRLLDDQNIKWKPSIHMPREAARIFLEVKSVKTERLQDITEEDAFNEGIDSENEDYNRAEHFQLGGSPIQGGSPAVFSFVGLWDSLNAKRGYSWESNPWVFVYEFERVMRGKIT